MDKNDNREGSTRQLKNGSWECITQAKYLNPKTAKQPIFSEHPVQKLHDFQPLKE